MAPRSTSYQYTDYSPDLSSLNDLPKAEELNTQTQSKGKPATAKRVRPAKKASKPKATQQEKGNVVSVWQRLKSDFTGRTAKSLLGLFLGCLGIYLLVAFISYFTTCVEDQSLINTMPIGTVGKVSNSAGEGGARLSEFLINESFGLGSLVIVAWLMAMCMKLLVGKPHFKSVNFTIKCFIVLITVSLIIGLLTISAHSSVNWGGYHGRYVNEFIINFIGWYGAVLLSLFMVAVFVVICMRDVVVWIMKLHRQHQERRRQLAVEKAEREAREAEILRMQQQERIDDMKAGEAAVIETPESSEIMDDGTHVDFSGDDTPLYRVDEMPESGTPDESEPDAPDIDPDDADPSESDKKTSDESDRSVSNVPAVVNGEDIVDENGEKMVVTVNSIGQTDKPHFKSEVDLYESHKYKFPGFELMKEGKEKISVDVEEQLENKERIKKTLLDFGIPITNITATVGPTVTLYEIVPDKGVKIAKIRNLVDDIALSLSAIGVRIIAPIPGKGTVGIEVANKDPQTVSMRSIIQSRKYQESRYNLPIALGSTISNDVYIADLAKMPHLLVAGATGQGKSVGLNAIITSLLYCKAPWQLKFVMIDPKQVEFSLYNKIRDHYMAVIPGEEDSEAVITDMNKVEATLNSLCQEMDDRYTLLKAAHTRNIEEYNTKIKNGLLNPAEGHRFLPYIVVIVDEFGDLIMVLGKSVEQPIARLAQKARAVGMHVIIATQRPSINVITGIIKANFPARISYKVSSGVDSKTILDASGAQQLIGRGDMLIFNNSEMVRVQCAFIDTPEVEAICDYVERQPYAQGPYILPEPKLPAGDSEQSGEVGVADRDPLFEEVARAIVCGKAASTSSIQRHYAIGYTRAGRIMDQLERAGIVGPNQGGKPRSVLVDMIGLENILSSL